MVTSYYDEQDEERKRREASQKQSKTTGSLPTEAGGTSDYRSPRGPFTLESLRGDVSRLEGALAGLGFDQGIGEAKEFTDQDSRRARNAIRAGDEASLRSILGYTYNPLTSIDRDAATRIERETEDLEGLARSLEEGRGLSSFVRRGTPGLSAGEARFEAQRNQDELRQGGRESAQALQRTRQQLEQGLAQRDAQLVEEREQADRYRQSAREAVEGFAETLRGGARERAEQERTRQENLQSSLDRFRETGDVGELEGSGLSPEEIEFLRGDPRERYARDLYDEIMGLNPTIADVDPSRIVPGKAGGREITTETGNYDLQDLQYSRAFLPPSDPLVKRYLARAKQIVSEDEKAREAFEKESGGRRLVKQNLYSDGPEGPLTAEQVASKIAGIELSQRQDALKAQFGSADEFYGRGTYADVLPLDLPGGQTLLPRARDYLYWNQGGPVTAGGQLTGVEDQQLAMIASALGVGREIQRTPYTGSGFEVDEEAYNRAREVALRQLEQQLASQEGQLRLRR